MKTLILIFFSLFLASGNLYGQAQLPPVPVDEQPEVQTRGPVNEAFAQPVTIEENTPFIVPKGPPADIDEDPPLDRPAGSEFAWIPGYWAWDSEKNTHIWISGCWRAVPPGKYWEPGYWAKVDGGYRWVPGFWANAGERGPEYLPQPPAVTYIDPPGADRPDMIWVPACWYWSNGRYILRKGYWIQAREDWVWMPSHYVWTPRGYVFVHGYWDYPFTRRGVLFAPVYFRGNIYARHRVSYSLSIVLDLGNLEFALFTRPGYRHYYFGDYYDDFYIGIGIFPWFECVSRRTWYDPIYLHDRWYNRRHKHDWWQHERREYERRRADRGLRPPRTYHEMERKVKNMPEPGKKRYAVAAPMSRIIESRATAFNYRRDKPEERRQVMRNSNELRNNIKERIQRESLDNARSNNLLERARPRSQQDIKKQAPEVRKGKANPYEIRIPDLPEERIKRDTRSYEQRKADAPSVKNSPEKSPDSSGRTAYPRPVRPEAKQAPLTAPSVQKNVTRSLQSKTPEEKPSSEASPFSLAPDRTKSEIKPKQGSSPRSAVKREPGKEKRARPGIEKIKR